MEQMLTPHFPTAYVERTDEPFWCASTNQLTDSILWHSPYSISTSPGIILRDDSRLEGEPATGQKPGTSMKPGREPKSRSLQPQSGSETHSMLLRRHCVPYSFLLASIYLSILSYPHSIVESAIVYVAEKQHGT